MGIREDNAGATAAGDGEQARAVGPATPELLSDLPILEPSEDRLGYTAYAEALAELIDSPGIATPLTISIDAPWGAGKTSLARLIERMVCEWPKQRGEQPHIVCWFNAWMHSDAANLGPALAAAAGKAVAAHRSTWRRALNPIPAAMLSPPERRRRRVLVLLFAALAALIAAYVPHALHHLFSVSSQTGRWIGAGVLAGVPIAATMWTSALGVAQSAATFVNDPGSQASTGSMADVVAQFARLVQSATRGRRRLVIFVDDLDRCPPERAVQMCETASLLLAVPGVVTVLIGDLEALRSYATHQFATGDAAPAVNGHAAARPGVDDAYGRSYFDKIVQLEFSLPRTNLPALATILAGGSAVSPAAGATAAETPARTRPRIRSALARLYSIICARPRRFAAYVGVTLAIWFVLIAIVSALDPQFMNNTTDWANTLATVWILMTLATWLLAGIGTAHRWLDDRRARQSTVQIDRTIRSQVASPDQASVETIKEVVAESVTTASTGLIEQRARRLKIERLVSDGSPELSSYLPSLPRSVKRMVNRHYLLASVAVSRNMIGGSPPLTAQHLAKWAVIMERWPELASEIIARPSLAADLERAAAGEGSSRSADPLAELLGPELADRAELVRLLHDATSLAAVADRLVFALPERA